MKKQIFLSLFLIIVAKVFSQPSILIESFATGFDRPVNIKNAGDDRLFVVEQEGLVQILNANGTVNNTPFLDIQSLVINIGGIGDERGLLGLAFHPQYSTNGFFYVNYINNSGDTVVSRFSVSNANNDIANANSELIILIISQPNSNHNGGDMAFGSDGFLYISSGDGGGSGDQTNKGQDLESLLGKILRIDVDITSNGNNYAIPSNNPFISNSNALDEIWAYGLRNPWKFSFDRDNGDIWIADVGQGSFEEINMTPSTASGLNYGWRCYEGNSTFNTTGCPNMSTLTFPVATYSHNGAIFRCSITGGYRYRGTQNPGFSGLYFFADYCSNEIGILEQNGTNWSITYSDRFLGNGWSAFGEDLNGELYIAGVSSGVLYKIKDALLDVDDHNFSNFKMYPNPVKEKINFDFSNTITPERITFYDIQGRLIKRIKDISNNLVTISIHNFKEGLYFVEILSSDGKKTNKKLLII
jgi:glucose/arabinose dehydrogenase